MYLPRSHAASSAWTKTHPGLDGRSCAAAFSGTGERQGFEICHGSLSFMRSRPEAARSRGLTAATPARRLSLSPRDRNTQLRQGNTSLWTTSRPQNKLWIASLPTIKRALHYTPKFLAQRSKLVLKLQPGAASLRIRCRLRRLGGTVPFLPATEWARFMPTNPCATLGRPACLGTMLFRLSRVSSPE